MCKLLLLLLVPPNSPENSHRGIVPTPPIMHQAHQEYAMPPPGQTVESLHGGGTHQRRRRLSMRWRYEDYVDLRQAQLSPTLLQSSNQYILHHDHLSLSEQDKLTERHQPEQDYTYTHPHHRS